MDTILPPLSPNTASASRRNIFYAIAAFVLLAAILGGTLWYANKSKRVGSVFDPAKQFVPKGAESREVDQVLSAFNLPKPLPFFDERNVVQSLGLPLAASNTLATTTRTYLSYRVFGQDMTAIHDAYARYFIDMGWKKVTNVSKTKQSLFFRTPDSDNLLQISFIEEDSDQKVLPPSHRGVVISLSLFPWQIPKPRYQSP